MCRPTSRPGPTPRTLSSCWGRGGGGGGGAPGAPGRGGLPLSPLPRPRPAEIRDGRDASGSHPEGAPLGRLALLQGRRRCRPRRTLSVVRSAGSSRLPQVALHVERAGSVARRDGSLAVPVAEDRPPPGEGCSGLRVVGEGPRRRGLAPRRVPRGRHRAEIPGG